MPKVDVGSATVRYDEFGVGPDLVWLSGGGATGSVWHRWQVPFFEDSFRNITFDNRGIGGTMCDEPQPWSIADFARDAAALIEGVCNPPVFVVGKSMGAFIGLQLALDRPDLVRAGVVMGTAACGHRDWIGDYMRAEVALRRAGGTLDGDFATTHYAIHLYPAKALGDPDLWPQIKAFLEEDDANAENERSLIPQWQACIDFDVRDRLPSCRVPLHVLSFAEDVEAPPQYGREVADLVPGATYHEFDGMGHGSIWGHSHDILNPYIRELLTPLGVQLA
jgi:pimeloyl-ACP methyl ester carboxylesterase